jgi:EF hand
MGKLGAITISAAFLACTAIPALPQQPNLTPQPEQRQVQPQNPGGTEKSEDRLFEGRDMIEQGGRMYGGRMGPGRMMGHMGERGMMHHGWTGHHRAMMSPVLMRMIFALMDSDSDGTVSLQEWQAAQEKIFRAMDVDKDGTITFEEMMSFFRGRARAPASQNRPQQ